MSQQQPAGAKFKVGDEVVVLSDKNRVATVTNIWEFESGLVYHTTSEGHSSPSGYADDQLELAPEPAGSWEQVEAEAEAALRAALAVPTDRSAWLRTDMGRSSWLRKWILQHHPVWHHRMNKFDEDFNLTLLQLSADTIVYFRVNAHPDLVGIYWTFQNVEREQWDYVRARIPANVLRAAAAMQLPPLHGLQVSTIREVRRGFRDLHVLAQSNATTKFAHTQGTHIANVIGQFLTMHVTPATPVTQRAMVQRWVPPPAGKRRMHEDEDEDPNKR